MRIRGTISFGVADSHEQCGRFKHGQVVGLSVDNELEDKVVRQCGDMLKTVIRRYDKAGLLPLEENCVSFHFVRVTPSETADDLHVVEVQVMPDWCYCKSNCYGYRAFKKKDEAKSLQEVTDTWRYQDDYELEKDVSLVVRRKHQTQKLGWPEFIEHMRQIEAKFKEYEQGLKRAHGEEYSTLRGASCCLLHMSTCFSPRAIARGSS